MPKLIHQQTKEELPSTNLFILLLIATIDYIGIGLVYPLFSTLLFQANSPLVAANSSIETRGLLLGLLLAACPLVQFFVSPLLGRLSDLYGRKKTLIFAVLVGAIGYLVGAISLQMASLAGLISSRILIGVSCASSSVVNAAMADISNESTKTRNFTWLSAAYGIGLTVGPLLGGFFTDPNYYLPFTLPMITGSNPARAFFASAAGLFLSMIIINQTYYQPPQSSKPPKDRLLATITPSIKLLLLSTFFFCFGWSLYWELISTTWVGVEGASVEIVANRYAYGALWYALLSVSVTLYIVKALSVQRVFYLGASLLISSMMAIYFLTGALYLYCFIPLQQLGISLLYPASISTLSSRVPANVQGTVLGFHAAAAALGFALSPLSAGAILPLSMYSPIFFGAGALSISTLLFFITRVLEKKSPQISVTA